MENIKDNIKIDKGWSEVEFNNLQLGDRRLEKRFCKVAEQLSSNLQLPIYAAAKDWASAKAAYRLFDNEKVSVEKILKPHLGHTLSRIREEPVVLAIQDTTYFNFSNGKRSKNLGPIGNKESTAQGMVMHHAIAVTPNNLPLGIIWQKIWSRDGFKDQTKSEKRNTPIEDKESYKWLEGLRETHRIIPQTTRVVTICDRESDIYEFFQEASALNSEFVIRASADRKLVNAEEDKFFQALENCPIAGSVEISLPQHDKKNLSVTFDVRIGKLTFSPPKRKTSVLTQLALYSVFISEQNPKDPNNPLQWRLITNIPVDSLDGAIEKIMWYRSRWQIEVFHKILKTGCDVEGCLLEKKDRIERYLVLFSVIAWRIFWMTHIARIKPNSPASDILSTQELEVLLIFTKPNTAFKNKLTTAKEAILAIAMLGGFLNRKNDGKPGPTPIWRGWQLVQQLALSMNKIEAAKVFATYG